MGCDLCPIRDSVEVPYRGNLQAEIIIVGEAPGGQEIRNRQPFIGPSGQLLMEQLEWAGIDPASVFYTNAARCLVDRDNLPSRDVKLVLELCRTKLELAISEIKPKAIILCGAIALEQIMRLKGIKGKRGNWLWSNEFNCHVMPTWHPAYILRNQTELENFRSDLQKVARLQKDHWEFDDKGELLYREVETIIPLLRGGFMREDGAQFPISGHRVIRADSPPSNRPFVTAIDTETQGVNWWDPNSIIISYSVAVNLKEAWNIYLHEEVDPESGITPDFTIKVVRGGTKKKPNLVEIGIRRVPGFDRKVEELRELCARNDIKKYFANLKFEKHRLYNLGITELNNTPMDVMIGAHCLDSERFLNNTLSLLVDSFTNLSVNLKGSLSDNEKSDMLLAVRQKRDIVNKYSCLQKGSVVQMADGTTKTIDLLVKNKISDPVMSYNQELGTFESKPITGWYRNKHDNPIDWHQLVTTVAQKGHYGFNGARYTPDHRILTDNGWVEAKDLKVGDKIATPYQALSHTQRQVVLGGLLGDGCIYIRNKDTGFGQFIVQHCKAQHDYLDWTISTLGSDLISCVGTVPERTLVIDGNTALASEAKRLSTIHHPELRDLYFEVYPNGEKDVGDWVEEIDSLGLAVWYMDDGSLVRNAVRLHTNGFSLQSLIRLRGILISKFGIFTEWFKDSRGDRILTIGSEEAPKFFKLVAPYIHPSMSYKLPKSYKIGGGKFLEDKKEAYYATVIEILHPTPSESNRGRKRTSYCIDVKDNHNFLTINEVVHNCFDACATLNVAMTLRKELSKDEQSLNYYINFVHPTECNLLFDLERNGILVDREKLPQVKKLIEDVMEEKVQEFKGLCSKPVVQIHKNSFKLSRRAILMDALFDFTSTDPDGEEMVHNFGFHLRPLKISAKSKLPVCDKDILTQLLDSPRTPDRAKDLILAYREWSDHNTLLTRYIKNIEETLAPDGRLHPSYSIKFTSSGRTGARNPSIQNFPKRGKTAKLIRMLIIAPPGKVLMEVDHSMSELRWVAHVANERKMKEIFSKHGDIHLTTGREVADLQDDEKFFRLSEDQIKQIRQRAKCFHPDVEVLTQHGWTKLKDLKNSEQIYQASIVEGAIKLELVTPTHLEIRKNHCNTLAHLKNEGIDLRITPDHRMLGCRESGEFIVLPPKDFVSVRRWWNAGSVTDNTEDMDNKLLRLCVATQADGSFIGSKIRFGFTKERKIKRIAQLLEGIPYTTGIWSNGTTWFTIDKDYSYKIKNILDSDKTFSWNLLSLSTGSRLVVLDEIKYWDSCVRDNWKFVRYSSKIRKNVDVIQALASITNKKTRLSEDIDGTFNLSIKSNPTSRGGKLSLTEFPYTNDVAVLSVPSTFVIVRDGGIPIITGQSINFGFVYGMSAAGFKNYARTSYHMRINDQEAQKYRVKYFNLYRDLPLWHKDCEDQIRSQGFIRTLFGRKRILPNVFSPERAVSAEAVRIGTNVIIQGPSSDATLIGGNNVIADPEFDPSEASINIFIHDALIFEIDEDKIDKYAKIIRYGMENIDTKTYGFNLTVPLLVEAEHGKNLSEMTTYNF